MKKRRGITRRQRQAIRHKVYLESTMAVPTCEILLEVLKDIRREKKRERRKRKREIGNARSGMGLF
jgi:hypothetical protein